MTIPEKQLAVKPSTIPGAGKGLFTKIFIPKGTRIIENTGKISTWKEVQHFEGENTYIFYVNRNKVIDSLHDEKALARYANDASGMVKVPGIRNNSRYVIEDERVYIEAAKDIEPGAEIFVSYGKEYWDVLKHNRKVEERNAKKAQGKGLVKKKKA